MQRAGLVVGMLVALVGFNLESAVTTLCSEPTADYVAYCQKQWTRLRTQHQCLLGLITRRVCMSKRPASRGCMLRRGDDCSRLPSVITRAARNPLLSGLEQWIEVKQLAERLRQELE